MYRGEPQVGADGKSYPLDETKVPLEEGMWLYHEYCKLKPERSVEIGLGYGYSTLFFLAALSKNNLGHHTAVDPYQRRWHGVGLTTTSRLAPAGKFRVVEETSVRAGIQLGGEGLAYDLIFIDGGHLFEQALTDFFLYAPLCKIGGLVVLDDMWMSSIKTVASFVRTNRNDFSEIPTAIPNLCVFRKIGKDEREWHYFRPFVADQEQGKIAEQA